MSMLPAVRVSLDRKLDNEACKKIHDQVSKTKGVLGAHFNAKAKNIIVTYDGGMATKDKIQKIPGVTGVQRQF